MLARALIAFLAMPGMAAFVISVFGEEPWLARTQGGEWQQYASQVPRWFR